MHSLFLALSNVPLTTEWNFNVSLVMCLSNVFAFVVGRFAIKNAGVGPSIPASKPDILKNFGVAELLATMSFGHILGAGLILGLASAGGI
jgi:photosystem I subunit X